MIEMLFWLGIFLIALWLECLLGPFGDRRYDERAYRYNPRREYRFRGYRR